MKHRTLIFSLSLLLNVALFVGCGGGDPSATTIPTSPTPSGPTINTGAALRVYVVQQPTSGAGTILQFPATASSGVSPASIITPGTKVAQVNTDQYGNIYYFGDHIVELASGASGSPTPIREIQAGTVSRICCVDGMGVSPTGSIVLGQDNGEIDEWSSTATGTVAPNRYILGASETGGGASLVVVANQVAVDASDNLFIGAAGSPGTPQVEVFSPTATGNAAPSHSVGSNGLAGSVAVDSSGNVYTTTQSCTVTGPTLNCVGAISVYTSSSTSNATPTRLITGTATLLRSVWGIKVDAIGNIYVISTDATGANPAVLKFGAGASGNVAPVSTFTSSVWTTPDFNPSIAIY